MLLYCIYIVHIGPATFELKSFLSTERFYKRSELLESCNPFLFFPVNESNPSVLISKSSELTSRSNELRAIFFITISQFDKRCLKTSLLC